MPDGCNLFETEADHKQIVKSLREGFPADVSEEVMRDKKPMMIAVASGRMQEILRDPSKFGHRALMEYIRTQVAGGEVIPESYARQLPSAIATVIKQAPDAMGLFLSAPRHYGRGATGLFSNLRHTTRGDAFAYELLATAVLIDKGFHTKDTLGGLQVYPTDRLDFGIKLQASYKNVPAKDLDQPRRGTVEADLFINRNRGPLEPDKIIGVDFKHSRGSTYDNYDMQQIKGIQVALQTGEIHEFCFVSNVKFSQGFKDKIQATNEELRAHEKDAQSEFDSRYLTPEERKDSNAPQIKIFEDVRYGGT